MRKLKEKDIDESYFKEELVKMKGEKKEEYK